MATNPDFPHLQLAFRGTYEPKFQGGRGENADVKANRDDPKGHASRIRDILERMRQVEEQLRKLRVEHGAPAIPADKGFLLKLPEGVDVDQLVRALGVELVAETEEGLMLVSSADLKFERLEEVLRQFETGAGDLVAGSSLLDIYDQPDDARRLRNILSPEILTLWPLVDAQTYIFDLGIQTATSTRDVKWPPVKQKKTESEAEFLERREVERGKVWEAANIEWDEMAESRVDELSQFIQHYGGEIISGMISDPARQEEIGMVFPDCVQVRVRMTGAGFRDMILNFAHLFDVVLPPELQQTITELPGGQDEPELLVHQPADDAATVCDRQRHTGRPPLA